MDFLTNVNLIKSEFWNVSKRKKSIKNKCYICFENHRTFNILGCCTKEMCQECYKNWFCNSPRCPFCNQNLTFGSPLK